MRAHLVVGFLWLVMDGGCARPVLDVPAEVADVEANRMLFLEPADHPLLDVEPGTVIDDLTELQGCWAFTAEGTSDEGAFQAAQFIRFDFDTGKAVRQILGRNALIAFVLQDVYALEPGSSADAVTLDLLEASADQSSPFLEQLAALTPNSGSRGDVAADPAQASPFDLNMVLDGDAFVIAGSTADPVSDASLPFVEGRIFQRFDCPQVK